MYLSCHLSSDCEIQKPLVPMTFYICIVLLVPKMHSKTCPLILMGSRYSFLKSKEIISPEVMGACWLITQIRNVLIKECSTKIHIHSWNEFIHREYFWEWNGILSFWNYKFLSIRLGSTFLYPSRDAYKDSHKGPQDGYLSGEWKESGVWSHLRDDSSGAGKGAVSMCLGSHLAPVPHFVSSIQEEKDLDEGAAGGAESDVAVRGLAPTHPAQPQWGAQKAGLPARGLSPPFPSAE